MQENASLKTPASHQGPKLFSACQFTGDTGAFCILSLLPAPIYTRDPGHPFAIHPELSSAPAEKETLAHQEQETSAPSPPSTRTHACLSRGSPWRTGVCRLEPGWSMRFFFSGIYLHGLDKSWGQLGGRPVRDRCPVHQPEEYH